MTVQWIIISITLKTIFLFHKPNQNLILKYTYFGLENVLVPKTSETLQRTICFGRLKDVTTVFYVTKIFCSFTAFFNSKRILLILVCGVMLWMFVQYKRWE
jgi:hypothetical protein